MKKSKEVSIYLSLNIGREIIVPGYIETKGKLIL